MKRRFSIRRAAVLTLTLALVLGCFWPSLTAEASDLTIDTSNFSDVTIDHFNIYFWHKGLPVNNSVIALNEYQVLMTWKGQYYFVPGKSFAEDCGKNVSADYDTSFWSGAASFDNADGISNDSDDSGRANGKFAPDGRYPHGVFKQNMLYHSNALLATIPLLNVQNLQTYGVAVTLEVPEQLPILIPTGVDNKYAIRINMPSSYGLGTTGSAYTTYGGFRTGENYLLGVRHDQYRVSENIFGVDVRSDNIFSWSLYGMNDNTLAKMDSGSWNSYIRNFARQSFTGRGYGDRGPKLATIGWEVRQVGDRYAFRMEGFQINDTKSRVSHGSWLDYSDGDELEWLIARRPWVCLCWNSNGCFESRGNQTDGEWYNAILNGTLSNWYGATRANMTFECYYAEPVLTNKLNTSFSVENGQVSNFDVATYISEGTVITVKEGGTLSITGWLMNNGTIKVEEGGTLYIQDGGCVNRFNDGKHTGGGIISNGLVLVGEGSKLIGGGMDGIQLLEGSHLVNYGCVASENFRITVDHSLENRGDGFVLYGQGNGVTGAGSNTYSVPIEGQSFAERGKVEDTCYVDIVANGIYSN